MFHELTDAELKRLRELRERKDLLKLRDALRELRELEDILTKAETRWRALKELIPELEVAVREAQMILDAARVRIRDLESLPSLDATQRQKLLDESRKARMAESRLSECANQLEAAHDELMLLSEVLGLPMPSEEELKPKSYAISTLG